MAVVGGWGHFPPVGVLVGGPPLCELVLLVATSHALPLWVWLELGGMKRPSLKWVWGSGSSAQGLGFRMHAMPFAGFRVLGFRK